MRDHAVEIDIAARVGFVQDEVGTEGGGRALGMLRVPVGELTLEALEPGREQLGGARVERGETAGHARLALRQHQLRAAGEKHRRADQRQGEPPFEQSWNGHTLISTIRFQTV